MSVLHTLASTQVHPDGWLHTVRLTRLQAHDLYHELESIDQLPRATLAEFMAMDFLQIAFDGGRVEVTWSTADELDG